MTKNDINLRIRKEYNVDYLFLNAELSYKGKRRGKLIEIRPDISIKFSNENEIDKLITILSRLGYEKLVLFIKNRERWKLDRIEFEIDKKIIADDEKKKYDLGSFCQATIETDENVDDNEINQILWNALNELGYSSENFEKNSYIELYFMKKNK